MDSVVAKWCLDDHDDDDMGRNATVAEWFHRSMSDESTRSAKLKTSALTDEVCW